jgi:spore maturation protein SpmA
MYSVAYYGYHLLELGVLWLILLKIADYCRGVAELVDALEPVQTVLVPEMKP